MIHFPFDEKKSLERFKSKSEFLVKSQSLYSEFSHFTNFFFDFRDAQDNSDRGNRERSRYSPDHAKTNSETTNPNFLVFLFLTEEIQYHNGLRSRELGQTPILLCAPNS